MASRRRVLYTGITNDLERRVYEHKTKAIKGFTSKYNIDRLVYFEETSDFQLGIAREKQIKAWTRAKRIALIESLNPAWKDLSDGWYDPAVSSTAGEAKIPRFARNDSPKE